MGSTLNSLIGLVILALDIWAIINIVKSNTETGKKVLWVLLILFLPVVGLIIWALLGPRGNVRI
ncbi:MULTISPECIES: PLD nuclease N-terminal domain-containing protein [unclassified Pseudomonas]|uniref:PLD nuclease N-terminal domain-containing protein n=1 Tax=unclassified Pseudomonas TaxID=196821 RepID=UPI002446A883|nr:PLD nuclease N-terminal domain-containing protein [Pseudomonas sp. GD03944]MDH1262904.1 PLD nuclease N-terminal domain-containing protein [Pseudomonas sp. GD03944]HWV09745.1 PLD nuclease N-terminal domain-containing protein [Pseudomonas sp.]